MKLLPVKILEQPDDSTCGPTCLHAIYSYHNDPVPLEEVINEINQIEGGGTLGVILGMHALERGYTVKLYTYNLLIFDPSWFLNPNVDIAQKLKAQMEAKEDLKVQFACQCYLKFLEMGGEIRFQDLTPSLIRKYLTKNIPILTGLSATYLYQCPRELPNTDYDDVRGQPAGHFVVLAGYNSQLRNVLVADPWQSTHQGFNGKRYYWVNIERVISSILLGIVTYDANLLIIEKKEKEKKKSSGRKDD